MWCTDDGVQAEHVSVQDPTFVINARPMIRRKIGRGDTEVNQCLRGKPAFGPTWRRNRPRGESAVVWSDLRIPHPA